MKFCNLRWPRPFVLFTSLLRHRLASCTCVTLLSLVRCASPSLDQAAPASEDQLAELHAPLWTNGGFEADPHATTPPSGWSVTTYLNQAPSGSALAPPASLSDLRLGPPSAGVVETFVVAGTAGSQVDPDLGADQGFRFPRFGSRAARVNYKGGNDRGANRNVNLLSQTMAVSLDDADPVDGQVHVRFAIAPVLENPSHPFNQQPYYYVELLNVTRGRSLYRSFRVAGQQDVPWNTTTGIISGYVTQWVDWQLVDIVPGADALGIGDRLQLNVVAGGCALAAHFGRVYVDALGTSVPGLYASASGPLATSPNATVAYDIGYANGGNQTVHGAYLAFQTPPNTVFAGVGSPGCIQPAVGDVGRLWCPIGNVPPGASGSVSVAVKVSPTATGTIVNGNYGAGGADSAMLLGMPVTTQVLQASAAFADLAVQHVGAPTSAQPGDAVTFVFRVTNAGPTSLPAGSATVTDVLPAGLTPLGWSCVPASTAASGTHCGRSSGVNNFAVRPALAAGDSLTYTVNARVGAGAANATLPHAPRVTVTRGALDPNPANDVDVAMLAIAAPATLHLSKGGSATNGGVSVQPLKIGCDANCTSLDVSSGSGSLLRLVAAPAPGSLFAGWSGACSGNQTTCSLALTGNQSVVATFEAMPAPTAAATVTALLGSG